MENLKYTPGPWTYEVEKVSGPHLVETFLFAHGDVIGRVYRDSERDNSQANARLIAAAPDLLVELSAAHRIIRNALNLMTSEQKLKWARINEHDGVDGEGVTRANEREAVIAKAEGRR